MGSGASAAAYDTDEAWAVFQPPPEIVAAASITDSTVDLAKLEELANITSFPFPREGLTFALSARELQRTEEDGETLKDAVGGKEVNPGDSSVPDEQMVRAWEGPVRVKGGIDLNSSAFTLALWVRVLEGVASGTVAIASGSGEKGAVKLLSLEDRGSGLSVADASPCPTNGQRDVWQLLLLQATGPAADLFVASDHRMVRPLASVKCKQLCARLDVLGGPGLALAEAFVWSRCLTEEERTAVFVRGAISNGSTAIRTLGWSLLAGKVPPENPVLVEWQERIAGMEGIAELKSAGIADDVLPTVLAALLANSSLHTVILAVNKITVSSGPGLLDFLDFWAKPAFVLDLQNCKELGGAGFEKELLQVFERVRGMGVKVLAQGTGLSEKAVKVLTNDTPEAKAAAQERESAIAATQEMTEVFMAHQAQLAAVMALETDDADDDADCAPAADVLERLQELNAATGVELLPPALAAIVPAPRQRGDQEPQERGRKKKGKRNASPERLAGETEEAYQLRLEEAKRRYEEWLQQRKEARKVLKEASESKYSEKFQSESPGQRRGSGMLMAHFSYIGGAISLAGIQQHSFFGLLHRQEQPRILRSGALDFQEAVAKGICSIVSATGVSFGKGALHLTVRNTGKGLINAILSSGTIFEHVGWVHKQNLMVINSVKLELWPQQDKCLMIDAHCMNLSCACSAGENMCLTDFYFDDTATIAHQSKIWNYFQGKFKACKETAAE